MRLKVAMRGDEMGAARGLEWFACVGPVEGVRHGRVVIVDEVAQLRLQVEDAGEVAATQAFALHDAEENFDLIEP